MMRPRLLAVAALAAAFAIAPAATYAQQMPQAPDGTSINEPPAAGTQAAVDACGNTPETAFGQTTENGVPTDINTVNPKDVTAAQPMPNMSSVTGFIVHTAGDLVLLQIPRISANGMDNTTPTTPDKTMAVVRLPNGCAPSLTDGLQVKAVGMSTMEGILNAELFQAAD